MNGSSGQGPAPGLPDRLRLGWLLLRETLRALAFPLHMLAHLPRSKAIQAAALDRLRTGTGAEGALPARPAGATPVAPGRKPTIFLAVGDPSGETHALALKAALEAAGTEAEWTALGGERLAAAGVTLLADLTSRPVMGLGPVLARIPFFCGVVVRTLALFRRRPPDLVVLVDSPALNLLLGAEARRRRIPTLYYICPQLWGWAPWRLRRFGRAADAALCIFPFEPPIFAAAGVHAGWAGHPVADTLVANPLDPARVKGWQASPTLALLPGSRPGDIAAHLPLMVAVVERLRTEGRPIRAVVAQEDGRRHAQVRELLARLPGGDRVELTGDLRELVAGARLTLVKSGTSSLECALLGAPNLVLYVLESNLLRACSRRFLAVPWFGAANLIAGREVVPEFLLLRGEADRLVEPTRRLWDDPAALEALRREVAGVRERALKPGAAGVAARWVRALLTPDQS